jgi:hypothetical protein
MIGFHYQRSDGVTAAEDFVTRLRSIGDAIGGTGPALVCVILDGENCWEHYPGGGVPFLRSLYQRCTTARSIRPWTIGEYLDRFPPSDSLPHLFAGSWISHNFAIWVGHEEDNSAWDALHRAREFLMEHGAPTAEPPAVDHGANEKSTSPSPLQRAWDELYIAEGSDWFWWYGDDHSSAQDALFDYLFRKHLQNIYQLLGETPPNDLETPISRRAPQRSVHTQPRALLNVKIDGRTTFFEWASGGRYTCADERGTMAMGVRGPIKELYFGFSLRDLFLRVDFESAARSVLPYFDALRIGFIEPSGWELEIDHPARRQQSTRLLHREQEVAAPGLLLGIDQIVECAIGFDRLGVGIDEPLQFYIEILEGRQSRDRAPRQGSIKIKRPTSDFERIMWDV